MVNHMVNFLMIFNRIIAALMVSCFAKIRAKIHGHSCLMLFGGLSGQLLAVKGSIKHIGNSSCIF
jgi:hypothetical protein